MKKFLFFIILILLISLVNCATEPKITHPEYISQEKCDAPVWNEGNTWQFVGAGGNQWEEKIIIREGRIEVRQRPQKGFHGFGGLEFGNLFPLWVGKKMAWAPTVPSVEGVPLNYFMSFKVIGLTDAKTEAGIFKSYKIEFRVSHSHEEGVGHYYYSPETKSIVKFETRSFILSQWENYELMSFNVR